MKLNFCTLFDSNYLSRGIAMYQSLIEHCNDFHLYVFAFNNKADEVLRIMNLRHVTVISLRDFEDNDLLSVKPTRSAAEYCWTCTSSTILYCIKNFNLHNCTYIDADLLFYQSPAILIDEKPANDHVIITSHRYTSYYDLSKISGKYCVQFMYFDNTQKSLEILNWWRTRCIEWCYNRIEDGRFGDQKYLDDWTTRFDCVWDLQHLGGGVAPWNVQQYKFENVLSGKEKKSGKTFSTVFYHFHGLKFYDNQKIIHTANTYYLSNRVIQLFYNPYIRALEEAKKFILQFDATFDPHGTRSAHTYFIDKFVKGRIAYLFNNSIKRIYT